MSYTLLYIQIFKLLLHTFNKYSVTIYAHTFTTHRKILRAQFAQTGALCAFKMQIITDPPCALHYLFYFSPSYIFTFVFIKKEENNAHKLAIR